MNHRSFEQAVTTDAVTNITASEEGEAMMIEQEAAAYLGVSLPYLLGLLAEGKLTYEEIGQERRLRKEEVLAYQQRLREVSKAALREMVRLNQEMGFYD